MMDEKKTNKIRTVRDQRAEDRRENEGRGMMEDGRKEDRGQKAEGKKRKRDELK